MMSACPRFMCLLITVISDWLFLRKFVFDVSMLSICVKINFVDFVEVFSFRLLCRVSGRRSDIRCQSWYNPLWLTGLEAPPNWVKKKKKKFLWKLPSEQQLQLVNTFAWKLGQYRTRDRKVANSSPSRSSWRISFFRVNFLCKYYLMSFPSLCYHSGT